VEVEGTALQLCWTSFYPRRGCPSEAGKDCWYRKEQLLSQLCFTPFGGTNTGSDTPYGGKEGGQGGNAGTAFTPVGGVPAKLGKTVGTGLGGKLESFTPPVHPWWKGGTTGGLGGLAGELGNQRCYTLCASKAYTRCPPCPIPTKGW
jgi:hypothetical protein